MRGRRERSRGCEGPREVKNGENREGGRGSWWGEREKGRM